jgi:PPM family protein phosphatase
MQIQSMSEEEEITAPLETETLQAGWAAKSSARPRCHAYLVFGAKTDLGRVRENNEDKFDYFEPAEPAMLATKGRVFAVADGMGGHSAGQVAAELALNVFTRSYYANPNKDIETSVKKAIQEANAYVVDVARTIPGRSGMGATLVAAIVCEDDLFVAWVGDSRCYLLRDGQLHQITEDHSWVAEQVRAGAMSLEEAEQSPFRNVITRSMGGAPDVEPELTGVKLEVGDRYLLCSDGLSGMIPAAEMAELLAQSSPSMAAWNLIERANQYGGKDNITVFVLHVAAIEPWPEGEADDAAEPGVNGQRAETQTVSAPMTPPPAQRDPEEPGESDSESRGGFMSKLFRRN